jgi:hypothetical protein
MSGQQDRWEHLDRWDPQDPRDAVTLDLSRLIKQAQREQERGDGAGNGAGNGHATERSPGPVRYRETDAAVERDTAVRSESGRPDKPERDRPERPEGASYLAARPVQDAVADEQPQAPLRLAEASERERVLARPAEELARPPGHAPARPPEEPVRPLAGPAGDRAPLIPSPALGPGQASGEAGQRAGHRHTAGQPDEAGRSRLPQSEEAQHRAASEHGAVMAERWHDRPASRPEPGSPADLRQRLEHLPTGHPSSPYHDDGTRKPPTARLKHLELAPPGRDRTGDAARLGSAGIAEVGDARHRTPVVPDPDIPRLPSEAAGPDDSRAGLASPDGAGMPAPASRDTNAVPSGLDAIPGAPGRGSYPVGRSQDTVPVARSLSGYPSVPSLDSSPAALEADTDPAAPAQDSRPAAPQESRPAGPVHYSGPAAALLDSRPAAPAQDIRPAAAAAGNHPAAPVQDSRPAPLAHDSGPAAALRDGHQAAPAEDRHPAAPAQDGRSARPDDTRDPARPDGVPGPANQPAAPSSADGETDARAGGPHTAADGSWNWASASLTPDQARIAQETHGRLRAAEGRNLFGSYGNGGLTAALHRIEAELEHGRLASDAERPALIDPDVFKAELASMIRRHPGAPVEDLSRHVSGALSYAFVFDPADYSVGTWLVHDALRSQGFRLDARKNGWSNPEHKYVASLWRDLSNDVPFQVQFHTNASFEAQQLGRMSAKPIADPRTSPADVASLRSALAAAWAAAASPAGTAQIGDYRRAGR